GCCRFPCPDSCRSLCC
uniref:Conotoxin nt3a n=1 Tax=Conus natalis TaxID=257336 RepID=CU3A_CONNA|nr:RecName: Full=Conotoxin nt3a [Conus natalis]